MSAAAADRVGVRLPPGAALRDLGEHAWDIAQPERVYQLVHPDLPADFPALRALHASAQQLPTPLDRFVGREREMRDLTKALAEHRLVTVTGPGGSGKTRLAVQVAREQADTSSTDEDGEALVVFVDLAPLSDPALLPERLAAALGGGRRTADGVHRDGVRRPGYSVLVIADNCEHLPTAGRLVGDLLAHAVGVRVLATSREPLRVPGEQEFDRCRCPTRPMKPTGPRYWRRQRCGCSRTVRRRPIPPSSSRTPTRLRWPRSVAGWTGCRWRSSCAHRGCARLVPARCWRSWPARCTCWRSLA